MHALRAQVRNGRITLDASTDLPDGEIYLVPVDDELDEEERAALDQSIEEGLADAREGRHEDASVVMDRLRSRREDPLHKAG